ncbi:MAG: histone deacetylase [Myxococcota bacterium]|nr:histone deacetylase [Myxococcota bacterium]
MTSHHESPLKIGWFDTEAFDAHKHQSNHPEAPIRVQAIREELEKGRIRRSLERIEPRAATFEEMNAVHPEGYLKMLQALCEEGGGFLGPDTTCIKQSWEAATRAAGALCEAVENILHHRRWPRAFCSVRPPGHHAPKNKAMGFCLLNNVAIAAEKALTHEGIDRVAIIDWDVHHGNGTQDIFYDRNDVYFFSIHQSPLYPGTGPAHERGRGAGHGFTKNIPFAAGFGDDELLQTWRETIRPSLEDFQPQIVLISAGFDGDHRDPLGGLEYTPKGYEAISAELAEWAKQHCQGRVISALEGGYNPQALAEDVRVHLETFV